MNASTYWYALQPEIILLVAAGVVTLLGVARSAFWRALVVPTALTAMLVVVVLSWIRLGAPTESAPPGLIIDSMTGFIRVVASAVGVLILLVNWHIPDPDERGEFFAMLLCSIAGVMFVALSDDLVLLLFALELVSVPTYVLVALSTNDVRAPEAAGKYFFLGAMSAAVMVYGFSFLYGAAGTTIIGAANPGTGLIAYVTEQGFSSPVLLIGLALSIGGLTFKLAAVPFHTYVADVYQGAASPISGALGFLPKAAGIIALIRLLIGTGATNEPAVFWTLWIICVTTMTAGNVLALLQQNVKRVLAYSSVSHSGYMLIGLLVGPSLSDPGNLMSDGIAATLFYLSVYAVMNLGAFAVLSYLIRRGKPAEDYTDLNGLWRSEPVAALALAICVFGLMGFPPTAGFAGKLFVFSGAFSPAVGDPHRTALLVLAVVAVINAAIGAVYYLRIVAACYLGEDREPLDYVPAGSLRFAVTFCAMISLCFGLWPRDLMTRSKAAASELTARVEPIPPEADRLAAAEPAVAAPGLAEPEASGQDSTPIKER